MKDSLPQPFHLFGYRLTARRLAPSLKWEAGRVKGSGLPGRSKPTPPLARHPSKDV